MPPGRHGQSSYPCGPCDGPRARVARAQERSAWRWETARSADQTRLADPARAVARAPWPTTRPMEEVDMESTSTTLVAGGGSDPAEHLITVDPAMERIVKAAGPITFRPLAADAFNTLARSIVFQQLA